MRHQVERVDPRGKAHKTVPKGWQAVCDDIANKPAFYQDGAELTSRKVQDRYEKIEKNFERLYLNPGTNGSDKQELTPLQRILKASAMKKANLVAVRAETTAAKAAKAAYLGDVEKQFHMRGPSPSLASPSLACYDSTEEALEIERQENEQETSEDGSAGDGARPRKKGRVSGVGGEDTLQDLLAQMTKTAQEENARVAEAAAAQKKERAEEAKVAKKESDEKHREIMAILGSLRGGSGTS